MDRRRFVRTSLAGVVIEPLTAGALQASGHRIGLGRHPVRRAVPVTVTEGVGAFVRTHRMHGQLVGDATEPKWGAG